jgi:ribose 5-phosphate isomerase
MFWLQGKKWDEIINDDFIIIMPNPRFNNLTKPLRLPFEVFPYMHNQVITDLQMWYYHSQLQLSPWDIKKGEVKTEDLKFIENMTILMSDLEQRKRKMAEMQMKNQQQEFL